MLCIVFAAISNNREKMEKMGKLRTNYTNPKLYEARHVQAYLLSLGGRRFSSECKYRRTTRVD